MVVMKRMLTTLFLCLVMVVSAFAISFKSSEETHPFDSIPMLDSYYDETPDSDMDFWGACQVSLLTIGAGGPLYSWFGHSAFLVEAPTGRSYVFDYGTFSFNSENFIINFVMGRLWFLCLGSNAEYELEYIKRDGRQVSQVVLPLDAAEKKALIGFLNANVKAENRVYLYHHYNDNCATRLRDIIDRTTGGDFKAWAMAQDGYTFRQQASRALCQNRFVQWGLDFLQSGMIDRKATLWEEMFLPEVLEQAVKAYYGLEGQVIVQGNGEYREMKAEPQSNVIFSLVLGLVLGGVSTTLIWFGKNRANYIYTAVVDIFFGLLGTVLLFMMLFTNHDVTWFNENILFVNPFLLVLAAFSLGCLSRKGDRERRLRRERRVTYSYLVLVCLVFILTVLKVLFQDIFIQFNWSAIATMFLFYLPNWLRMNRYKIEGREPESDMNLIY